MIYSREVEEMCPVAQGVHHGAAPIPEEAKWVQAKEVKDISGLTHGVGWCAPQQGACKLTLNVKEGIIQEALVETIGCSGMTHSAAMASEILPGLTVMEALNTDLVCDAINTAMRELFLQIVYGRTQSAFSEDGLPIGAGLEDLGKGLRSQVGTMYGTLKKGPRYLEMTDGYVTGIALNEDDEIIGYQFVNFGKMMDFIKAGDDANTAFEKASGQYGRVADAVTDSGGNLGLSFMVDGYVAGQAVVFSGFVLGNGAGTFSYHIFSDVEPQFATDPQSERSYGDERSPFKENIPGSWDSELGRQGVFLGRSVGVCRWHQRNAGSKGRRFPLCRGKGELRKSRLPFRFG